MEEDLELMAYSYMWDGSEDWALAQHYISRVEMRISFENDRVTINQLAALRKLLPEEFGYIPPAKLRLQAKKGLILGIFDGITGMHLYFKGRDLGLNMISIDLSTTIYGLIRQGDDVFATIEDDNLVARIAAKMIEHGRPIVPWMEED